MAFQAVAASLCSVSPTAGGLLAKMAGRGTLPSTGMVSPMKTGISPMKVVASPGSCGESDRLVRKPPSPAAPRVAPAAVASSPLKASTVEVEPRTPGEKGKTAGKTGASAAPASVAPAAPKGKAKAKAKSSGKGTAAATAPAGDMLPPRAAAPKSKKRINKKAHLAEQDCAAPVQAENNRVRAPRPRLPPKLPEDNYDMSDREGSSDEIPMEVDRSGKHVPAWVEVFEKKAIEQADWDPGSIFGRSVPVCDLDEIFTDQLYRKLNKMKVKRVRGSSCRWGPDRLNGKEIQVYAQKMGQRKRLSMFQRASLASRSAKTKRLPE